VSHSRENSRGSRRPTSQSTSESDSMGTTPESLLRWMLEVAEARDTDTKARTVNLEFSAATLRMWTTRAREALSCSITSHGNSALGEVSEARISGDAQSASPFAPRELIVQIRRQHTTSRSYDAVILHIGDMAFSRDIVSDRDIRQAKAIADHHDAEFWVSSDLQARVDAALEGRSKR
jgi:hypothetical protein